MKQYMVLDRVTGSQVEVAARDPYAARDFALASWDAQKIPHGRTDSIEVYEKLDPKEEAQRDQLARSSLQWLEDGRGAIRL